MRYFSPGRHLRGVGCCLQLTELGSTAAHTHLSAVVRETARGRGSHASLPGFRPCYEIEINV